MMNNRRAWKVFNGFDRPFLATFSDRNLINLGEKKAFQQRMSGANAQPHCMSKYAGHVLKKGASKERAKLITSLCADNSKAPTRS